MGVILVTFKFNSKHYIYMILALTNCILAEL